MLTGQVRAKGQQTWDECGIEEKVERLRRELRALSGTATAAYNLAARVGDHQHGPRGEILVPLHGGPLYAEGRSFDPLA